MKKPFIWINSTSRVQNKEISSNSISVILSIASQLNPRLLKQWQGYNLLYSKHALINFSKTVDNKTTVLNKDHDKDSAYLL